MRKCHTFIPLKLKPNENSDFRFFCHSFIVVVFFSLLFFPVRLFRCSNSISQLAYIFGNSFFEARIQSPAVIKNAQRTKKKWWTKNPNGLHINQLHFYIDISRTIFKTRQIMKKSIFANPIRMKLVLHDRYAVHLPYACFMYWLWNSWIHIQW